MRTGQAKEWAKDWEGEREEKRRERSGQREERGWERQRKKSFEAKCFVETEGFDR